MKPYILYILLLSSMLMGCGEVSNKSNATMSGNNVTGGAVMASDILLKTTTDKDTSLSEIIHNKASVFIFLSPECPLSQSYSLTLNDLSKEYKKNGIYFYGIFPGKLYPIDEIIEFQKKYSTGFPLLLDTAYNLTHLLNATVTPEVFVLDGKGTVLYSGRIDNWAYEVSKKRDHITEHNLQDALECIVNNTAIRITKTQAVGCFIETQKQ